MRGEVDLLILSILFAIFGSFLITLIIGLMKAGSRADDIEERTLEIMSSGPQRRYSHISSLSSNSATPHKDEDVSMVNMPT